MMRASICPACGQKEEEGVIQRRVSGSCMEKARGTNRRSAPPRVLLQSPLNRLVTPEGERIQKAASRGRQQSREHVTNVIQRRRAMPVHPITNGMGYSPMPQAMVSACAGCLQRTEAAPTAGIEDGPALRYTLRRRDAAGISRVVADVSARLHVV